MKKNKVLFYAIWATVLLCILSIIVCIALGKDDDAAVAIIPPDISIDCYSILLDDSFVFFPSLKILLQLFIDNTLTAV